ncbi:hypothetical protein ABPG72_003721 [Tetrahymena utriculariae]
MKQLIEFQKYLNQTILLILLTFMSSFCAKKTQKQVDCRDLIYESDCARYKECKYYNVDNKDNGYCVDKKVSECYQIHDILDCGQVSTCFWNFKQGLCQNLLYSQDCNDFDLNIQMCNSFNSLCRYEGQQCLTLKQYEDKQIERKKKIQEIREGRVSNKSFILNENSIILYICFYIIYNL